MGDYTFKQSDYGSHTAVFSNIGEEVSPQSLVAEIDSLQSQLSEAQAQCERLREAAGKIRHWHDTANDGMIVSAESVRELWNARNQTPAQSLAEIQIQTIQKFVGSTFQQPFVDYDGETIYKRSEEYISRLRQQGKEE